MYKLLLNQQEFIRLKEIGKLRQMIALIYANIDKFELEDIENYIIISLLSEVEYNKQKKNHAFYCPITGIIGTLINTKKEIKQKEIQKTETVAQEFVDKIQENFDSLNTQTELQQTELIQQDLKLKKDKKYKKDRNI